MAPPRRRVVIGSCTSARTAGCLTQVDSSPARVRPRRAITPEQIYEGDRVRWGATRPDGTGLLRRCCSDWYDRCGADHQCRPACQAVCLSVWLLEEVERTGVEVIFLERPSTKPCL